MIILGHVELRIPDGRCSSFHPYYDECDNGHPQHMHAGVFPTPSGCVPRARPLYPPFHAFRKLISTCIGMLQFGHRVQLSNQKKKTIHIQQYTMSSMELEAEARFVHVALSMVEVVPAA
jgi:hypothetical protein